MSLAEQNGFGKLLASSPRELVAKVSTLKEAKNLRDMAELARHACRKSEVHRAQQNKFAELSLLASRECGERLRELKLSLVRLQNLKRGPHSYTAISSVSLEELGLKKHQSSRFQAIAQIPKPIFERYLEETIQAGGEISTAGLLRYAKAPVAKPKRAAKVKNRHSPIGIVPSSQDFTTLFIDVRGFESGPGSRKTTRKLVRELSGSVLSNAPTSHLYLALRDNLLLELPPLIKQFRFRLVGAFAWNTSSSGGLLPVSAELFLVAVKGGLPFRLEPKTLQIAEPATDGYPSELLFETVRTFSPGPYLRLSIEKNELCVSREE